uniref:Rx N-terminal domain-containing protein n=1 Tax=Oryza brachyantha TaxID=4533 RepID=J3NDM3_ORYBR
MAEAATGAVVSLLERLNRAEEEEAALAAAAESLRASLPWLVEQLEMAKDDAKEEMAQLETMPPQLAGDGDDVLVLFKAERRFAKSLRVLRRFM